MDNSYYVYGHYDSEGTCVYIGKGTFGRAWAIHKNPKHNLWMHSRIHAGVDFVSIIQGHMTDKDAKNLESDLIKQYDPKWNILGTQKGKDQIREMQKIHVYKKVSTPDGEFESITACANHYGITHSSANSRFNSKRWAEWKKL